MENQQLNELRKKAQEKVQKIANVEKRNVASLSREEIEKALHDLQVYQVELEIQNEELINSQLELVEMRDKYQFLFDFAPVGYISIGLEGLIEESNKAFAEMVGQDVHRIHGRSFRSWLHSEDSAIYYDCRKKLFDTQLSQKFEARLLKKGVRIFPAQISLKLDNPANPTKVLGIISDITALKQAEGKIRASEKRLQLRNHVAQAFLLSKQKKVFQEVVEILMLHFSTEFGYFGFINEKGDLEVPSMTSEIWEECEVKGKSTIFPRDHWGGLWGDSLKNKKTIFQNKNLNPPEGHLKIDNAIAVPLITRNQLVGQILLANRKNGFTSDHVRDLEEVTAYIAPLLLEMLQQKKVDELRRKNEETAKRHAEFLQALINTIPNPVYYVDEKGKFLGFNNDFVKFTGISREQLKGRSIAEVLPVGAKWDKMNEELLNGHKDLRQENECSLKNASGEEREMICYRAALPGVILGTFVDVSALKMRERMLQEMNATKDKFFSIIAHDIKNPFGALIGFANLLDEDFETLSREEIHRFVKRINNAADNTYRLLENLLHWSRMQTGRMPFVPEKINLKELSEEIFRMIGPQADNKSIILQNHIKNDIAACADRNMVDMILRNLLTNAIKFSHPGGKIVIDAEKSSHDAVKQMVTVHVKDDGIGIDQSEQAKLFRASEKVKTQGTAGEQGTGLGLILSKEFVRKCDGDLWLESAPGQGSTFSFSLPEAK